MFRLDNENLETAFTLKIERFMSILLLYVKTIIRGRLLRFNSYGHMERYGEIDNSSLGCLLTASRKLFIRKKRQEIG